MRPRYLVSILAVSLAVAVACEGQRSPSTVSPSEQPEAGGGSPTASQSPVPAGDPEICGAPLEVLMRVARGYVPGRSGDIMLVENRRFQLGTRHSTPWPYTQRVPLVLFGRGHIRANRKVNRPVTVADIAPTTAALLGSSMPERDGSILREALDPSAGAPPRLVVTLVWDGGGRNVLERWPRAWPYLRSLLKRATWYERATVGSAPSITPAVHATIGTGSFPRAHGIPDIKIRAGGKVIDPYEGGSPRFLRQKTFAERWDEANDNKAKVGMVARDLWHLGMIGHGSYLESGDKDVVVLDDVDTATGFEVPRFYRMPGYVEGLGSALDDAIRTVDVRDGSSDGRWLGVHLNRSDGVIRATPAWSIYQTRLLLEIIRRERFGRDRVTDLLFTNYKSTDLAGHQWNMEEPQVRDALRQQDAELKVLIDGLDRLVGRNRYVLILTADHGMTPYPRVRNAWSIDVGEVTRDVDQWAGAEVVKANRGYNLILDKRALRAQGKSLGDLTEYLRAYTIEDNSSADNPVTEKFEKRKKDRIYASVMTEKDLKSVADCPP